MWDKIRKLCCLGMFTVLFLCAGCEKKETFTLQEIEEEQMKDTKEEEKQSEDLPKERIFVYVCGEVNHPGVYDFLPGSRLYEAIEAAGGLTPLADESALNLAEELEDGGKIYVVSIEETIESGKHSEGIGRNGEAEKNDEKVNINTAAKEELMTLTGIGEAKADSIIRYREEHGEFDSAEDIMQIEGIKEGVFHKIKEQITVK